MSEKKLLSDDELTSLLQKGADDREFAEELFGSFSYAHSLSDKNYSASLDEGIILLNTFQTLDREAYTKIHKGTPFYWLGTAAFMLHDFQTAVFFYDAAVSEDLRAGANPIDNSTPALRFLQLDGEAQGQAAKALVEVTQARVQDLIDQYNNATGRPKDVPDLTIQNTREYFLRLSVSPKNKSWRTLASAFISFILEWDYRNTFLDLRIESGTAEPFFIHLFKGCVLFESLLKANPNHIVPASKKTLGPILQELHKLLNIPNDLKIGNTDFPTIIRELEGADNSLITAIQFTGRIRNTVGHNLGWEINITKLEYQKLYFFIAVSCLHAISCLYIPRI
ncbi:hypothetical protein ACFLV7_04205 [Chloroflexota bacterium]